MPPVTVKVECAGTPSDEEKAQLTEEIAAAGLSSEFHYHGVVDRKGKIDFLQSLAIASVPTDYAEPKGLFLLEAMAAGLPVVVTRSGGPDEIVEHQKTAWMVAAGDADALAEGVRKMVEDKALRQGLAEAGRAHAVATFDLGKAVRAYQALYESALS